MTIKSPITKVSKQRYLICFDYVHSFIMREFVTLPMTEEEFETDFRGNIKEEIFPIFVKGNRKEHTNNEDIWDDIVYTRAMYDDPNILLTIGVYNES